MQEIEPLSPRSQIEEEQNEIDDFSFASLKPDGSPISAEDAFLNGQIRAMFDQRRILTNETSSGRSRVSTAPELGKKSHSTGFSKLWRFGDKNKIRRSSSDGKEAFVFLRSDSSEKNRKETASYNHERLYGRNRAENEKSKRKSYLPYRSNLMAFFHYS